ncbi:MAG TPA: DUF1501 domain-containing protein, partial [Verrucomicrobiales bacterium]|nr:DUF1501 domain-containing protein [Verrucomicrobiales bacterium]
HGGQVLGATDATASEPTDGGWSPDDIAASFYRNIGIDPHREYHIDTGRPIQLIRNGKPIEQIFTGAA